MSEYETPINEDQLLRGLLEAVEDREGNIALMEVARKGKVFFSFRIRAITEKENNRCLDLATKYKMKRGVKMADETDHAKYRSLLIHTATVEDDRQRLWDNKRIWERLNVLNGVEVIDRVLHPGEKEAILNKINEISGYAEVDDEESEGMDELAKN